MYSSTTGPRRVRRVKIQEMSAEVSDSNVRCSTPALRPLCCTGKGAEARRTSARQACTASGELWRTLLQHIADAEPPRRRCSCGCCVG